MLTRGFHLRSVLLWWSCLVWATATPGWCQPPVPSDSPKKTESGQDPRYEKFQNMLSGVKLVGHFTIAGQDVKDLKEESYEIRSVTKLPTGDLWLFQARIRYGDRDMTLPLPLEVKWAGDTPIITLDDVTIPGLGTFGARVVIHDQKYAGTWRHGDVGGHLFGKIEKLQP